ncbi:PAS domain S-box protein [Leptolyngbya ohadii]|uniref:PAS domain S-box protein n=1 Tax=Leptolyngbya ohadii TaxID=1962290 RepID=UPI00117A3609|nr:PAS domain S-box protein [Leptolyngbya ohadii]
MPFLSRAPFLNVRRWWIVLPFAFLLLLLAHGVALIYRVQPAVSLWFPPSGVAIVLTMWLGPIGVVLTGLSSIVMAPLWGSDGWYRFTGITDAIEPLIAWCLYRQFFRGSLLLKGLRNVVAFLVSVPLLACASSAILGTTVLVGLGRIPGDRLAQVIGHWWLGNAIGTMAIVPTALLLFTPFLYRSGWLAKSSFMLEAKLFDPDDPVPFPLAQIFRSASWSELLILLVASGVAAGLTVIESQHADYSFQLFSLLSFVPILWTATRFGVTGGMTIASFCVALTLLAYIIVYPKALMLPAFPVSTGVLNIHKFSLLVQCVVSLCVGTAMTERAAAQVALAVERVRAKESQARASLAEQLVQLNASLSEANQQLQQSEERFRTSVENMLDCFAIYSTIRDESGKIVDFRTEYVNPAACLNNRMTKEEQLGRRLCELLPNYKASGLFDEYCRVVETGEPLVSDSVVYEDDYNGEYLRRTFELRAVKLEDGIAATWRNITDRKAAEDELFRRKQEFMALVENSPDVVSRLDRELRHLYVSPAVVRVTGLQPENFIGKSHRDLGFSQKQYETWQAVIGQVFKTGREQAIEFELDAPNGESRFYQARFVPEFDLNHKVESVLGVTRDITDLKRTEEALRRSEELSRTVLRNFPNGAVMMFDHDLRYTLAEGTALEQGGLTPQDVENRLMRDVLPPETYNQLEPLYRDALRGVFTLDEIWFADRLYLIHVLPVKNDRSEISAGMMIIQDITEQDAAERERQKAEAALRQSETRFSRLAENVPGVIYQLWMLPDGGDRFNYISSGCLDLYEVEADILLQTTAPAWNAIHPDDLEAFKRSIAEAIEHNQQWYFQWRIVTPSGKLKWVQGRARSERRSDGTIIWDGLLLDVTERKQAEEALTASEARLRSVIDSNLIGVFFGSLEGAISDANQAFLQITGYSREDLEQGELCWAELTPPEYFDRMQTGADEIRTLGTCTPFEKEFIRKDGSRIWVEIGGAMIGNGEGVGYVLDLTERKRIESERAQLLAREQAARKQAEAASRTKDEFLAIVSHELRSPLSAMLGWSRLLVTRKMDETTTRKALEAIERNAQAQTQLIEDLLDISRIIRGKVRLYTRPVNLVQVVEAAIDTVRPTADTKSIGLNLQVDASASIKVSGDPDRLQQVIWNLLSNGIKFTPKGGQVTAKLSIVTQARITQQQQQAVWQQAILSSSESPPLTPDTAYAQIQIIDTGKGISEEFLPYVFDRFRQAESATTRSYGGLGLGLAIVRNLVELHGGFIQAESEGEGKGATFTVYLPLLPNPDSETEVAPATAIPAAANLEGICALVVDDEADVRELIMTILEQYGMRVLTAGSVREALEKLDHEQPDVLLSDIGMPLEDGYALIRQVRAKSDDRIKQIPAAAITAFAREEDRMQAINAGFQVHISKPLDPARLITVVTSLVNRRR